MSPTTPSTPTAGVAIYVNPAAGGGRAGRLWARLQDDPGLERPTRGARVILAHDETTAVAELDAALADDALERLIVVGGDGSVHLAVNRLLEAGRGGDLALGVVPAGTGSDLARCLGLPHRPTDALRHALEGAARPLDALKLRLDAGPRHWIVNVASAGLSGAVSERVNQVSNRGRWAYLRATFAVLLRGEPAACRVEVDGRPLYDGELFVVAVANGRYFGKGMNVAPDARADDGLADVVVVPPVPLWTLPWRLPLLFTGGHVRLPFVRSARGRTVRLIPRGSTPPFELDGENLPAAPATITVAPGALRVVA